METNKTTSNIDEMPLSPEEIKAIGEIELGPARHEIFLNKHYKKLIIGGIAFMVAASAAIGYYSYKNEQKEQAGALVVQAMGSASQEGAHSPAQYDAAALSQINTAYADTNSADLAQLLEALSLMTDSAQIEGAIGRLEALASGSANELIRARALASLAAHYMSEEKNDKATACWKQIISMPSNPYSAIAYLNLGDMAKLAGDKEAARNYYTQVSTACPNSPLVSENVAGLRLALLDVEAPTPVAAPPAEEKPTSVPNPFGIDTASPFGPATPAPAPADGGDNSPFGGMSTLPGGNN